MEVAEGLCYMLVAGAQGACFDFETILYQTKNDLVLSFMSAMSMSFSLL